LSLETYKEGQKFIFNGSRVIDLKSIGTFEMEFYYFMYCRDNCNNENKDSLEIFIIDNTDNKLIERKAYFYTDMKAERQWIKEKIQFRAIHPSIKVNSPFKFFLFCI
jgi:hypothetical protein